jgi:thymidylate synthase (FAD)
MKLIKQSHQIIEIPENALKLVETAARTCYKSERKISPGSDITLVKSLIGRGHHAMLEFGDITVRFITNRGVTHELVRHRLCSFAQESTRYVRYDGKMEIVKPVWWQQSTPEQKEIFLRHCEMAEQNYRNLLQTGWQPQQAREVLPNALKTEIVVKANLREWRHIFSLRCSKAAHPQIRNLMLGLLKDLKEKIPLVFDDIQSR